MKQRKSWSEFEVGTQQLVLFGRDVMIQSELSDEMIRNTNVCLLAFCYVIEQVKMVAQHLVGEDFMLNNANSKRKQSQGRWSKK